MKTQAFHSVTLCFTLHQHVAVVPGARHRKTAFPDTDVPYSAEMQRNMQKYIEIYRNISKNTQSHMMDHHNLIVHPSLSMSSKCFDIWSCDRRAERPLADKSSKSEKTLGHWRESIDLLELSLNQLPGTMTTNIDKPKNCEAKICKIRSFIYLDSPGRMIS